MPSQKQQGDTIKYKIWLMQTGVDEDVGADGGVWECSDPQEVTRLVEEKHQEGWVLHKKKDVGDWGFELFFRRKQQG